MAQHFNIKIFPLESNEECSYIEIIRQCIHTCHFSSRFGLWTGNSNMRRLGKQQELVKLKWKKQSNDHKECSKKHYKSREKCIDDKIKINDQKKIVDDEIGDRLCPPPTILDKFDYHDEQRIINNDLLEPPMLCAVTDEKNYENFQDINKNNNKHCFTPDLNDSSPENFSSKKKRKVLWQDDDDDEIEDKFKEDKFKENKLIENKFNENKLNENKFNEDKVKDKLKQEKLKLGQDKLNQENIGANLQKNFKNEMKEIDYRCLSKPDDLDKKGVLTAMGGLFYAGELKAVEPPDILEVYPRNEKELTVGTRERHQTDSSTFTNINDDKDEKEVENQEIEKKERKHRCTEENCQHKNRKHKKHKKHLHKDEKSDEKNVEVLKITNEEIDFDSKKRFEKIDSKEINEEKDINDENDFNVELADDVVANPEDEITMENIEDTLDESSRYFEID
ncbi:glutamic acid-rich protein-like [Onthophagus taurus]|uniref:glutamic acid-rich protein-like n=1 Tax=Onthophagus taurus TaxID=166361 RepID=UPI0039BE42FC